MALAAWHSPHGTRRMAAACHRCASRFAAARPISLRWLPRYQPNKARNNHTNIRGYNFSNESGDIMSLCQNSLNHLNASRRMCRRTMLSVARREAVVRLDEFIGPKW